MPVQSVSQPSLSIVFPSSHSSSGEIIPFPHAVTVQFESHPSPFLAFASSHPSPLDVWVAPSPQNSASNDISLPMTASPCAENTSTPAAMPVSESVIGNLFRLPGNSKTSEDGRARWSSFWNTTRLVTSVPSTRAVTSTSISSKAGALIPGGASMLTSKKALCAHENAKGASAPSTYRLMSTSAVWYHTSVVGSRRRGYRWTSRNVAWCGYTSSRSPSKRFRSRLTSA